MFFQVICQVFFAKKSEVFNLEKLQNLMKKECFLKTIAFILLKGIFNKTGGRKICRSCFQVNSKPLFQFQMHFFSSVQMSVNFEVFFAP